MTEVSASQMPLVDPSDNSVLVVSQPASMTESSDDMIEVSVNPLPLVNPSDNSVSVVSRPASMPTEPSTRQSTSSRVAEERCIDDEVVCEGFVRHTCGCKKAPNKQPCSSLFSIQHYMDLRAQAALLAPQELDMVLIGSLMTTILDETHTVKDGRHASAKRSKMSSNFMHHGHKVCKHTFSFLYGLGVNHRVLNVRKHYQDEGMMVRVHKTLTHLHPGPCQ